MKFLLSICALLCISSTAYARGGPVGLGVVGEDPSGLTAKFKLGNYQALDFRLGLDGFNNGQNNDFLLIQGNYLVNVAYLVDSADFKLPLYIGGGLTLFFFDFNNNDDLAVIARLPIGLDLEFADSHLDVFVEVAPQLVLAPGVTAVINGAVGIRYFF
jgi:hypothetical protein